MGKCENRLREQGFNAVQTASEMKAGLARSDCKSYSPMKKKNSPTCRWSNNSNSCSAMQVKPPKVNRLKQAQSAYAVCSAIGTGTGQNASENERCGYARTS